MSYLIDANVLIAAHRSYYSFGICPGFWEGLLGSHEAREIISLDRVKDEMSHEGDALAAWISKDVPTSFFEKSDGADVVTEFAAMMQWAQDATQYKQEALSEFASVADAWLVAYAKVKSLKLVTLETLRNPNARKRVPIPNVCAEFGVTCITTFEMLEGLGMKFDLSS